MVGDRRLLLTGFLAGSSAGLLGLQPPIDVYPKRAAIALPTNGLGVSVLSPDSRTATASSFSAATVDPDATEVSEPLVVTAFSEGVDIAQSACGDCVMFVLTVGGDLYSWCVGPHAVPRSLWHCCSRRW